MRATRPLQIDGGGPRGGQRGDDYVERLTFLQSQCHAVGGGGADQRRPAHLHDADRMGGIGQGFQADEGRFARQHRLVEDDDRTIILADGGEFAQLSFPWQCLYFLPLPQGQGSLRPTLGRARSCGIGFFSSPVAAAASASS